MKKYTAKEIEGFLKTIDGFLKKEVEIIVIGGTAAALAYHVSKVTQDIDTWNSIKGLAKAYEQAKEETGLNIPLSQVTVGDAPHDFEDRLVIYKPGAFQNLKVLIPEVIDLILMKTLRGYEHDLEAIDEMVKSEKVKFEDVLDRYVKELGAAIGEKRKLDLNFLAMVERCYGDGKAEIARKRIGFN